MKYTIAKMADLIVEKELVKPEQKIQLINALSEYWNDKIGIVWTVEDVLSCAEQHGTTLSKEQAINILKRLEHNHDATIGINWDIIAEELPKGFSDH